MRRAWNVENNYGIDKSESFDLLNFDTTNPTDMKKSMSDPLSMRLSDGTDPERGSVFKDNCDKFGCSEPQVVRNLVDAWNRFVKDNGHPPKFPATILPIEDPKKARKPAV